MKGMKKIVSMIILLLFSFVSFNVVVAEGTQAEVTLEKTNVEKDPPTSQDTIYKPKTSTPVKLLPQTGEIVTSFIYIIIGLSLLIFILGLIINKTYLNTIDVRWDY